MYVCMYIYIDIYDYIYIYYAYIYIYTSIHLYIHTYIHTYIHITQHDLAPAASSLVLADASTTTFFTLAPNPIVTAQLIPYNTNRLSIGACLD